MSDDSTTKPWLFNDYVKASRTVMDRRMQRLAPQKESELKKPYLFPSHLESELTYTPTGYGPGTQNPITGGYLPQSDCSPTGDAIGGGNSYCVPGNACGKWVFTCAHKITGFAALGGTLAGIEYLANDTVAVTACWDKVSTKLTINIRTALNDIPKSVSVACVGPGHDSDCNNCDSCSGQGIDPVISYTSQQMSTSGTQNLSASGGGGGPYKWSIIAGGGTLAKSITWSEENNLYTAPSTNAECANNPTIQVIDFCGSVKTLAIAINANEGASVAYTHSYCTDGWNCPTGQSGCAPIHVCNQRVDAIKDSYQCNATFIGGGSCAYVCATGICVTDCATECAHCSCPYGQGTCESSAGYFDQRTAQMITDGCCPAVLL